ncbi:MAG: hypothetical protein INF91_12115 [Alphaproteobacteria bacterium]|nr:hypothetical protein [Alphaproteobacteria bacterium]
MANTIGKFDFDMGPHGARFRAVARDLSAGCLTDGEIDEYARWLKDDIDAVAKRMKKAVRNRPSLLEMRNPKAT